jgi:endonuclease/exonuclease/phosphatase family metal-dependent hydrolase
MPSTLTFATWNILATAYIRPEYYPHTPPYVLRDEWRVPALVRHAEQLNADILCLQELEAGPFAALRNRLAEIGYSGSLAMKGHRRPDGCATFLRAGCCKRVAEQRLLYRDGVNGPSSGHVAQVTELDVDGVRMDIVNTHLKWDSPETPRDRQWGYRQASLVLERLAQRNAADVQVVCGDFNVTFDSPVIGLFTAAGFECAHPAAAGVYSYNSNREPKLIDYVFFRGPLRVQALAPPAIDRETAMPSPERPSDHLPLMAQMTFL